MSEMVGPFFDWPTKSQCFLKKVYKPQSLSLQETKSLSLVVSLTFEFLILYSVGTFENEQPYDAIQTALSHGYRHIDTARYYDNEKEVGKAIKDFKNLKRSEIFITSKVFPYDLGTEATKKAFYSSLQNLGLDYIDLYLIHWPAKFSSDQDAKENARLRKESWLVLEEMKKLGKVKDIGVSKYVTLLQQSLNIFSFMERHLEELLKYCSVKPVINQCECHPLCANKKLRDFCMKNNIVFESYRPLAGGEALQIPEIQKIAQKYKKTPAQVAIRWNLQNHCGMSN